MSHTPKEQEIIQNTLKFVQSHQQKAESAHDYWHVIRVWNNAKLISKTESVDTFVVELAALLHDIADSKFNNGDEEIGATVAGNYLNSQKIDSEKVQHIQNIIRYMSFKGGNNEVKFDSLEKQVVQDADRLEAIGAIGIARAFTYGGYAGRPIYNPEIPPNLNMSVEEYKKNNSHTINHFYEKLLLLKDKMNTNTGKKIAVERHAFLELYLDRFYREWKGEA